MVRRIRVMGLWDVMARNVVPGTVGHPPESIAPKEFSPIMVSCIVWGKFWRGCAVCCHCDNSAVVSVINTQNSKEPLINPQRTCAARVTVVGSVCVCVCLLSHISPLERL